MQKSKILPGLADLGSVVLCDMEAASPHEVERGPSEDRSVQSSSGTITVKS